MMSRDAAETIRLMFDGKSESDGLIDCTMLNSCLKKEKVVQEMCTLIIILKVSILTTLGITLSCILHYTAEMFTYL